MTNWIFRVEAPEEVCPTQGARRWRLMLSVGAVLALGIAGGVVGAGAVVEGGESGKEVVRLTVELPASRTDEFSAVVRKHEGTIVSRPGAHGGRAVRSYWDRLQLFLKQVESVDVEVTRLVAFDGRLRVELTSTATGALQEILARNKGLIVGEALGISPVWKSRGEHRVEIEFRAPYYSTNTEFVRDADAPIKKVWARLIVAAGLQAEFVSIGEWHKNPLTVTEGGRTMSVTVEKCTPKQFVILLWNCSLLSLRPRPRVEGGAWARSTATEGQGVLTLTADG